MTWRDIIAMAIHNLWQRRLRTLMNQTGVVIGCIVLLMTAAGANGVRAAFQALFDSSEFARQIEVYQSWNAIEDPPEGAVVVEGEMDDERRERIRNRLVQKWKNDNVERTRFTITREMIEEFEALDHVSAVVPNLYVPCSIRLHDEVEGTVVTHRSSEESVDAVSEELDDRIMAGLTAAGPPSPSMQRSLLCGELIKEDDRTGVLVHEFLAYQLGFQSDAEIRELPGQRLTIEWRIEGRIASMYHMFAERMQKITPEYLAKQMEFLQAFGRLMGDLDKTTLTDDQKKLLRGLITEQMESRRDKDDLIVEKTFTIRGVYRAGANQSLSRVFHQQLSGEHVDLQVHRKVASELKYLNPEDSDYYNVVIIAESTRHLKEITDRLKERGAGFYSALGIIDSINWQIEHNSWIVYGVAAAILLTAAIGISNTLIISVMERTPEFGTMKALGAKDRDLVRLMMIECAVLGLFGALCAVVLSWLLSFGIHYILQMYIENEIGGEITGALFNFTMLPILLTFAISTVVCSAASIAPAVRAARLDPVVAMQRT